MNTDTASSTLRALRTAAALLDRELARALDPHGLTAAQYAVLHVMGEVRHPADAMACSELGRRLTGVAPDVTRLLDRLESGGLVARERDLKDRRVVHTRITPEGRAALERARPDVERAEHDLLAALSANDQHTLAHLLAALQSAPVAR